MSSVIKEMPQDWLGLTTHRLDVYNEKLAKTEFIEGIEKLFTKGKFTKADLEALPTAYDYIRLGHPLSSILEWAIGKRNSLPANNVIAFDSNTMPLMAVLRHNLNKSKPTKIIVNGQLPENFDEQLLRDTYHYIFEIEQFTEGNVYSTDDNSSLLYDCEGDLDLLGLEGYDFILSNKKGLGSILILNEGEEYIDSVQHVRRRETVAMTPINTLLVLKQLVGIPIEVPSIEMKNRRKVTEQINTITNTSCEPLVASSGLSMQYAIMMGLLHQSRENHPGKAIKIVVPPNCYGGTNDQARRVAHMASDVEILDLPVDGKNDMVRSTDKVLADVAAMDAVPLVIAEIPTNPRVEVPDLNQLGQVLTAIRKTKDGKDAIPPVFILDQTFCPNYNFLGNDRELAAVQTIAYVSGSKFPSGGKVTAGYCVANDTGTHLLKFIKQHLNLCDNEATTYQFEVLAQQLPSMLDRIKKAYENTREFVEFIQDVLPEAKMNFVSKELAEQGFTPSVFSLDLPTGDRQGDENEQYKRTLNNRLIDMMINQLPGESKYCVSYGQLRGMYWTIPATSTQGTTREEDKDYIARVSVSPSVDLEKHKKVFKEFVATL
ncbi:MAG: PLP-dependent transferase [Nonlabens sp.]